MLCLLFSIIYLHIVKLSNLEDQDRQNEIRDYEKRIEYHKNSLDDLVNTKQRILAKKRDDLSLLKKAVDEYQDLKEEFDPRRDVLNSIIELKLREAEVSEDDLSDIDRKVEESRNKIKDLEQQIDQIL